MEIIGRIIEILDVVSGENERGEWQRGGFVVETLADYPITLQLDMDGERLKAFKSNPALVPGSIVKARFGVSSRKIGDKWFTNAKCWEVGQY